MPRVHRADSFRSDELKSVPDAVEMGGGPATMSHPRPTVGADNGMTSKKEEHMRVLVATHESQGCRTDDFDWCLDGELVWVAEPCDRDRRGDANSCGCGRAFAGMASHRSTTTAIIREMPDLTLAAYEDTLRMSLVDQGWPGEWAEDLLADLIRWGATWPEGTILERHLDFVGRRFDPSTGRLRPPFKSLLG